MHKPRISIIAAIDENNGLGKDNDLLFRIPGDAQRLRLLTMHHPLVMGRKTFLSLGRLLSNRAHIVITRDKKQVEYISYQPAAVVSSLEEGIEKSKTFPGSDEIFIFGGGQVFKEAVEKNLVDRLYLTIVKGDYHADTFFPDYSAFTKVLNKEEHQKDGYTYTFLDLEK